MEFSKNQIIILNEIYINEYNPNKIKIKTKLSESTIKKLKKYNLLDYNNEIPNTLFCKYLKNILLKKINLEFLKRNNFQILL